MLSGSYLTTGAKDLTKCPDAMTFSELDARGNELNEEPTPRTGNLIRHRSVSRALEEERSRLSEEPLPGNGTNHNFRQAFQSLDVNRNRLSEEQLPGNGTNHNFRQAFQSLDVNRNRLSEEQLPGNGTNLGNRQAFQTLDVNRNMLSEEQLPGNGAPISKRSLKVVFVGMGPNALWSALQLKAKQENTNIEMFEKRTEYARNHTVNIDDSCFDSIECFDNDILREGLKTLRKKILNRHGQISCKDFETDLKAIAERMGITMHAGKGYEVVSISDGEVAFNAGKVAFDALVCADGAHSKGRKALLQMADNPEYEGEEIKFSELSSSDEESEFKSHRDYQYRVRVKYQIEGQTERLSSSWFNFFRYGYATFKAMLSPVDERVRPLDNSRQEVTIDFFITKDEYKSLHGYNLKKGAKLSASKLAPSLKEKIENWMSIKNNFCQEAAIIGSEEITPYVLSSFHARKVQHVTASGKLICIAGDAATSLPYFRSLNNFLVVGAELGRKLGSVTKTELSKAGKDYESYAGRRALLEGFKARAKNLFVNLLKLFLWTSNYAPWQINFWSQAKLDEMRSRLFSRTVSPSHHSPILVSV